MKENVIQLRRCPNCGQVFSEPPALSRSDNETLIYPDCGTREALDSIGVSVEEQEKIIQTIHRSAEGRLIYT